MWLTFDALPLSFVEFWKERIAFGSRIDTREVQPLRLPQRLTGLGSQSIIVIARRVVFLPGVDEALPRLRPQIRRTLETSREKLVALERQRQDIDQVMQELTNSCGFLEGLLRDRGIDPNSPVPATPAKRKKVSAA